MEFLEGNTLKHRIGTKPFTVDALLDIGIRSPMRSTRRTPRWR
jgi:hypothetical protein